jgi:two-component system, chemotaxis family, chemotaxis protein CheY
MHALIVDDSRFIRCYLRALLEAHGIPCEAAGDGNSGLDCVRRFGPYGVALIDWHLPGMNGLEMVQTLRRNPALGGMKIVMVTTEADGGHIAAALEAGADEYLIKPFDGAGLLDKLQMAGIVAG